MTRPKAHQDEHDPWESGELGRDDKHVRPASPESEKALDDALELQMISIRLQKDLLSTLKVIARYRGIGYQPLIRDLLGRFARSELLQIHEEMRQQIEAQEKLEKRA